MSSTDKQEEKGIIIGIINFKNLREGKIQICRASDDENRQLKDFQLHIPDYQRPYAWEERQVETLLNDLKDVIESDKKSYLLGSLILHKEEQEQNSKRQKYLNIVDGQQRLVTLALICAELKRRDNQDKGKNEIEEEDFLMNQNFPHSESQKNLKNNFDYIKEWFVRNEDERKKFEGLLFGEENNKIEFICIITQNLDDAFIFFDSANSKGKALETYDLIKAYHLSTMNQSDEKSCIKLCAKNFEELCKKTKRVHKLFYELLFPARKWIVMEGEFYVPTEIIPKYKDKCYEEFCVEIPKWIITAYKEQAKNNMGILQEFEGGKDFFDYIEKYNNILSNVEALNLWKKIRELEGNGNRYLRFLFEIAMIVYFDKYGYRNFKQSLEEIALLIFLTRGAQERIERKTIPKQAIKILPMIYFSSMQCYMHLKCENMIRDLEGKYETENLDRFFKNELENKGRSVEDFKKFFKEEEQNNG